MPSRPNTPCRHPGCAALVSYGTKYCEKHRPLHPEDTRPAGSRGYGTAWNKARKRYLETHPLCVECLKQGRYVKATDVDHIKPHRGDSVLFWDRSNWQSLCHRHHSIKTLCLRETAFQYDCRTADASLQIHRRGRGQGTGDRSSAVQNTLQTA